MRAPALLLLCAVSAVLLAAPRASAAPSNNGTFGGRNVVLFLSDQERDPQDWPEGWADANLPGMARLKKNGLTFKRAYTNAAMCTAARACLFTGYLNPQHNARYVLEQDMPSSLYPQVNTPDNIKGLASAAKDAGYSVVYKGKMHLSKPINPDYTWSSADAEKYGWTRWNYPDGGANQSLSESGGSPSFNDKRFMESTGTPQSGNEGALQWILEQAVKSQPFFLVISLINPHDVLFYPAQFNASGYSPSLLTGEIRRPSTADESLLTKPSAQKGFKLAIQGGLAPQGVEEQLAYVNFYANLIKQTDEYMVKTMNALDATGLTKKTVIVRTADHGEMGISHSGQIQKNFNMYEQATRIPLIFSNPELYPLPKTTEALVSHADFVPTMATLLGTPKSKRAKWEGVDYSAVVMDPAKAKPPQSYVVFTFDDFQGGQAQSNSTNPFYVPPPCNVRAVIETRYKFAEYWDASGQLESEYEMYDLKDDPTEVNNLAWKGASRTPEQEKEYKRLKKLVQKVFRTRLQPLKTQTASLNMTAVAVWASPKQGTGNVTGQPVGGWPLVPGMSVAPGATIVLNYTKDYKTDKSVKWTVYSGSGSMNGKASLTKGLTKVTGGTGAYWRLKAKGIKFTVVPPSGAGGTGTVTIEGVAKYT